MGSLSRWPAVKFWFYHLLPVHLSFLVWKVGVIAVIHTRFVARIN
jgi:hypothetical protein